MSEHSAFSIPMLKSLTDKYNLSSEMFISKKAYKYFKSILNSKRAMNELWELVDRNTLFQTLYPVRYNEFKLANQNIKAVEYLLDEKLHFFVNVDGAKRGFKLSINEFLKRSENLRKNLLSEIKKDIDKICGYFVIYEDDENYYITDKNITNGKYKVLFEYKNGAIIKNNKLFETGFYKR